MVDNVKQTINNILNEEQNILNLEPADYAQRQVLNLYGLRLRTLMSSNDEIDTAFTVDDRWAIIKRTWMGKLRDLKQRLEQHSKIRTTSFRYRPNVNDDGSVSTTIFITLYI